MKRRIKQVNELLKEEISGLILREVQLPDYLITVCRVDCSADFRQAKIAISVLPENKAGSALTKLRKNTSLFSNSLKKRLNLKYIPRFNWFIDKTEENAAKIEDILLKIRKENKK